MAREPAAGCVTGAAESGRAGRGEARVAAGGGICSGDPWPPWSSTEPWLPWQPRCLVRGDRLSCGNWTAVPPRVLLSLTPAAQGGLAALVWKWACEEEEEEAAGCVLHWEKQESSAPECGERNGKLRVLCAKHGVTGSESTREGAPLSSPQNSWFGAHPGGGSSGELGPSFYGWICSPEGSAYCSASHSDGSSTGRGV